MKKFISALLTFVIISISISAFAENDTAESVFEETPAFTTENTEDSPKGTDIVSDNESQMLSEPTADSSTADEKEQSPSKLTFDKVTVTAHIAEKPFTKESDAVLELFDENGLSLGTQSVHITPNTKTAVFTFDVPEYEIGTDFILKATNGLDSIVYYEDKYFIGNEIAVPTYSYTDSEGDTVFSTDIAVTINPLYNKSINLYYNASSVSARGARVIDGNAMIPIRTVAEFIGFDVSYDKDFNTAVVSLNGKNMYFNVGTAYTTVFGTDLFAPYPTTIIDDTVYVSLRTFADAIGSSLEVKDYLTHLDINISESEFVREYYNTLPVNRWGIASRTNYMVWVSLSEYKVRLYQGKQYQWRPILEAPCAIGAPGTPTVTGSFEYNYKTRWDYGTYYVGPCLVFYRGYALHSVLLYQNGTEYDGRVGVKISHGCVRLKKNDIDFIANTIPVGTRIYITP